MLNNLSSAFDPNSPFLIAMPVVFLVFQFLFLVAFALYVIFAFVVVRQTSLMARTVSAPLEPALKFLTLAHLVGAIGIWILAFVARI
jgi:hypothetical protein